MNAVQYMKLKLCGTVNLNVCLRERDQLGQGFSHHQILYFVPLLGTLFKTPVIPHTSIRGTPEPHLALEVDLVGALGEGALMAQICNEIVLSGSIHILDCGV